MSVVKGKRSESRFEAQHNLYKVRHEVTLMMLNRFGYSHEKYQRKIDHYRERFADREDVDEIVGRMEAKQKEFDEWFIAHERTVVGDLSSKIQYYFSLGNAIYPSDTPAQEQEIVERRLYMDKAIGHCHALRQELQYIIAELPVDINKYKDVSELIDREIQLMKGVRRAVAKYGQPKKTKQ